MNRVVRTYVCGLRVGVEDDLTDWHEYLFNYDRMFREIEDEITAEVKAKVRERVMARLNERVDDMCNRIFND